MKIKTLVLTGDGLNCEVETAQAFYNSGSAPEIIHINDLIQNENRLNDFQILALPGGFSFGDEISSGKILALKLKYQLGLKLSEFISKKKLVIGICNGFQAIVKLGLLPEPFKSREVSLVHNTFENTSLVTTKKEFINQWVELYLPESKCLWTKSLQGKKIKLPIRHGEGRIVLIGDHQNQLNIYNKLKFQNQIALEYCEDINGSFQRIAGLCDPSGLILGLMPHPEAATSPFLSPEGLTNTLNLNDSLGLEIFKNAIHHLENKL